MTPISKKFVARSGTGIVHHIFRVHSVQAPPLNLLDHAINAPTTISAATIIVPACTPVVASAPDFAVLPDPPDALALLEADVAVPVPVPVPVAEDPEAEDETVEEPFEVVWPAISVEPY